MGIAERREREKENLRQEILAAASELFAKEGHANLSMRKIAEKIEYSPTTIYLYFRDKTDLLRQICEDTFAKLIEKISLIESSDDEPISCLEKGMRTYIYFGLAHSNHYEVTMMTPLADVLDTQAYPFEGSNGQKAFEYIVRLVTKSMEKGQMKQADIGLVSQTICAAIHGVTALLIAQNSFPVVNRDELIEQLIKTTLNGLRA